MEKMKETTQEVVTQQQSIGDGNTTDLASDHLERGLKPRHLTMIALGGALGTGLLVGTWVSPKSFH
jgi:amino acid permease